jgi:hypothetical protein
MTYPPGSPNYGSTPPQAQYSAPTQQLSRAPEPAPAGQPAPAGPSKLPVYLAAAVAVLGLAVYLSSFGPLFTAGGEYFTPTLLNLGLVASLLGALVAGVGLLPKQKDTTAAAAVLSVLGFLLVILILLTAPSGITIEWGLYLIIAFSVLQAIVAVAALLLDAGVITAPVPRPKYDQHQQYSPYGAPPQYYGQPQGQPHHPGQAPQQRQGYPQQQYGGGYPSGQATTAFQAPHQQQAGPPTPPTGFPTYGQPQASGAPANSGSPSQPQQQQPAEPTQPATQISGPPPS